MVAEVNRGGSGTKDRRTETRKRRLGPETVVVPSVGIDMVRDGEGGGGRLGCVLTTLCSTAGPMAGSGVGVMVGTMGVERRRMLAM